MDASRLMRTQALSATTAFRSECRRADGGDAKMPQGAPYIHSGDPAYAPPVLRAPSPSSSIGTDYPGDESTQAEEFMTERDFVQRLKLDDPREDEAAANRDPLLPKPKDAQQEALMHMGVVNLLRKAVQRLQDDEIFEQRILRGSLVTEQEQPYSGDIDSIMRSMMNLTSNTSSTSAPHTNTPGTTMQPPFTPINGDLGLADADLSFDPPLIPPITSMGPPPLPTFLDLGPNTDMNPMTSTPGRRSTRLRTNTRRP